MNNSFDLIEFDSGNLYKYMEYMTRLDAAHEPKICQINFFTETFIWINLLIQWNKGDIVIANNSFDLIESDPGNVYKYMECMTMLDAAHEPYICQIIFFYWDLYLKQFTDSMDSME